MRKTLRELRHTLSSKLHRERAGKRSRWRKQRLVIEQLESRAMLALTFQFNYIRNEPNVGFANPNPSLVATRTAALEAAAATFGSWFTQTATLRIDVEDFHQGPLDSDGAPIVSVPNTNPGFVKTVPEQKIQNGVDPNGTGSDGVLFLNWEEGNPDVTATSARWNYTDNVGVNELDFKGEVIHNLAHILGFQSQIEQAGEDIFRDPSIHAPGTPGTWITYDTYLSDANGAKLIGADFRLNLPKWLDSSTSGNQSTTGLFFNGANAKAANGGNPVPLYSPSAFVPGGTASHLRPVGAMSRSNTLMIAAEPGSQNLGLQVRKFTPIEAAMMKDLGYQLDTTPPTVSLSTSAVSPTRAPFSVTATISEAISAALVAGNITVTNGTVSNIQKVSNNFTFTVTPTAGISGTVTVAIPANQVQDSAGNKNAASNTLSVVIDTAPPTVTLSTLAASPTNGPFTVTANISEAITANLAAGNINITPNKGTVSNIQKVGNTFTFIVTPTSGFDGTISISIPANQVEDAVGNKNAASNTLSMVIDSTLPTVSLSTQTASPTNGPFTVTANISEAITAALVAGNITVSNGAVSNIQKVANNFTFTVTPTAGFNGNVTVAIPANQVQDAAGNKNSASNTLSMVIDSNRPNPFFVAPPTNSIASKVTLTVDFGETIGNFLMNPPVSVTGGTVSNFANVTLNGKLNSGITFDITPTTPTSTVTVGVLANSVKDLAGNFTNASAPASIVFGAVAPSQISGSMFNDSNNDGVQQTTERTVGGVLIKLSGTVEGQTIRRDYVTLADGTYHFDNLAPGRYTVQMTTPTFYQEGADIAGSLGDSDGNPNNNAFEIDIVSAGTNASNYKFANQGILRSYKSLIDDLLFGNLSSSTGLYAVLDSQGEINAFEFLDGYAGVRFAAITLSTEGRNALLTIVSDTHEIKTANIGRGQFTGYEDSRGKKIVRIGRSLSQLSFTTVNPASPPVTSVPKYLDSIRRIFAQEGWGTIAPNPSTTVAPEINVSKNDQSQVSLSVTASGSSDSFSVALNAPPYNGSVVLNLETSNVALADITAPANKTLTFTSTNWNIPQTVTVQGKNDGTPEKRNQSTDLTISVNTTSTTALNYLLVFSRKVFVETIDDVSEGTIIATGVAANRSALSIGGSLVGIPNEFRGSLAVGDVTGDGVMDYVLGSAPASPGSVPGLQGFYSVLNGVTNQIDRSGFPFQSLPTNGVNVALGDVNKDGRLDIIASQRSNRRVAVLDGSDLTKVLYSFEGFDTGTSVASADIDGDGYADIVLGGYVKIASPITPFTPQVHVISGKDQSTIATLSYPDITSDTKILSVGAGDLDGDGKGEIISSFGGGVVVSSLSQSILTPVANFIPFLDYTGIVSVAVNPIAKTIVAGMAERGSTIRTFSKTGQPIATFTPFGSSTEGVRVAVSSTTSTPRPPVPRISFLPGQNYPTNANGTPVTNQLRVAVVVDFGEAVTGFGASDLQVTGGTMTLLNEVNGRYRMLIEPTTPNSLVTVNMPAGAATNAAGVLSTVLAPPFSIQFDQSKPEPAIFVRRTTDRDSEVVGITFRKEVPGNFDASKLTAANGTISNLKREGDASFSFTLTPTTRGQATTISLADGFVKDVAGNPNSAKTASITFAIAPLIPKLSSTELTSTTFSPIPIQADFGTNVTGFSASTPTITNGSVQQGSVQNLGVGKYSFSVVPAASGTVSITIPANLVTDAANSSRKNVISEPFSLEYHPSAPKPEFIVTDVTNGGSSTRDRIPFQVVFSAPVDGFTVDDIQITGGTIENFQGEPSQPNFTFEVSSNGTGEISLDIPAGVAKDVDLVGNLASDPFRFRSTPEGDVSVAIASPPPTAKAGDDIYYLVTVSNYGRGTVTGAIASATLPPNLSYVPITGFLADSRVSASGQTVTINVGDLAAGKQQLFTVQLKLRTGVAANTVESVTFNVTGSNDTDISNNSATFVKTVIAGTTTPNTSATVIDAGFGGNVTVSVPANSGATITNLVSTPILDLVAKSVPIAALPIGVRISATSFRVNNAPANSGEIVVTLYPPEGVPSGAIFTKWGKRPGDSTPNVFRFMYDQDSGLGAVMFPDRIEIHLRDGKLGDDDGIVNGVIVDPGFMTLLNPVAPYQSTINNLDVDDDGSVSPLDILNIVNDLNANGSRALPSVVPMPISKFPFLDTDGDGSISPLDVLLVINFINARSNSGGGEGEQFAHDLPRIAEGEGKQSESAVPLFALSNFRSIDTTPIRVLSLEQGFSQKALIDPSVELAMPLGSPATRDSLVLGAASSQDEKQDRDAEPMISLEKSIDDFFADLAKV